MINSDRQPIKLNIKDLVLLISVFTMIYVSSSYNSVNMSGTLILLICGVCGILVVFVSKKDYINMKLLLIVILLSTTVLFTSLFTGDTMKDSFIMVSVLLISMTYVMGIDFKKYCEVYTIIILLIAVYSLYDYMISISIPSIIRLLAGMYYRTVLEIYNLGLSFVNLKSDLIRNMGIFSEPGAFHTYLVFAII